MAKSSTNRRSPSPKEVLQPKVAPGAAAGSIEGKTPEQLRAEAGVWDEARQALKDAGERAAKAQAALDALPADATDDQRREAQLQLDAADNGVKAAEATIERLSDPEGAPDGQPAGKPPAAPGGAQPETASAGGGLPPATNTSDRDMALSALATAAAKAFSALVAVTVIGPAKGLHRAGHFFDAVPRAVEVTPEQLEQIKADPSLTVTNGAIAPVTPIWLGPQRLPLEAFLRRDGSVVPVKVLGPAKGRRRAGIQFGPEALTIEVTRDQLALILGDPEISVAPAEPIEA